MATIDQIGLSLWTMQSTAARPGLWRALYRRLGEDAQLAEGLGFHAVWLGEHRVWYDGWCPAPLQALAHVAGKTSTIHLGTAMYLVPQHDPGSGGRLVLVARPAEAAPERYAESLDVIRHALAARPFRFEGAHWRVPMNLPQNVHQPEERVRVTPAPAQPRLEIWGAGPGRTAALERALGHLADADDDPDELARAWARAEASPAAIGAPRGRRERWLGATIFSSDCARDAPRSGRTGHAWPRCPRRRARSRPSCARVCNSTSSPRGSRSSGTRSAPGSEAGADWPRPCRR